MTNKLKLNRRDIQLLGFLHKGLKDNEIAEKTGLTKGTVRVYMHELYAKIKVRNRTLAALWWEHNKETAKPRVSKHRLRLEAAKAAKAAQTQSETQGEAL
jgi:DNA-binding CsgD family transcriptional regulator